MYRGIIGNYEYGLNIPNIYNGYVFKEILLAHENEHKNDWIKYLNKYQNEYYTIPQKIIDKCTDFNTYEEAQNKTLEKIKNKFYADFYNPSRSDRLINEHLLKDDPLKLTMEQNLQKRPSIQT